MRSQTPARSITMSVFLGLFAGSQASAGEYIFGNGFESGALCAWSTSCSLDSVLGALESAVTAEENRAALQRALEVSIVSIPPEVQTAVDEAAEFVAQFPATKGAFLTIAQAHQLATMGQGSAPTLGQALSALTADVAQAYAAPGAPGSAQFILMFSATTDLSSPLPLAGDTRLTFTGSFSYAAWLTETFPLSFDPRIRTTPSGCHALVAINQTAAATQVVLRNVAVVIYRVGMAIVSSLEAIVSCGAPPSELAGVVLDAVQSCAVGAYVSWVEVEADADCVSDFSGPPSVAGCVAGLIPCLGDVFSIIDESVGAVQAIENLVNGVCTVINSREGLHAACDAGCPECYELDVEPACGFGEVLACFDPLNSMPSVSCVESEAPACDGFGVPEVTRIDGPTIIPDGGLITNRLHFKDEDAGIDRVSFTVVTDTCGGCWLDNAWDPGVSQVTAGSFEFVWWCNCGGLSVLQATYHVRLEDSQGNVSAPYTRQVGCSCPGSGLQTPNLRTGGAPGGGGPGSAPPDGGMP